MGVGPPSGFLWAARAGNALTRGLGPGAGAAGGILSPLSPACVRMYVRGRGGVCGLVACGFRLDGLCVAWGGLAVCWDGGHCVAPRAGGHTYKEGLPVKALAFVNHKYNENRRPC